MMKLIKSLVVLFKNAVLQPYIGANFFGRPTLGLVGKLCEVPLVNMLETEIDQYIKETCSGEFERRWVDGSEGELEKVLSSVKAPCCF